MKLRKLIFISLLASLPGLGVFAESEQPDPEAVSLFDGKTLEGWEYNESIWRVEDGAITGGSHDKKFPKNDFISTKKTYGNFDLSLKIKCSGDPETGLINSGIQIRSARLPNGRVAGYQVDCGDEWFGKIYDEHRRRLIYPEPLNEAKLLENIDTFGWNEYRILAEGPRIQVWINGIKASDYTEKNPRIPLNGIIAPQVHSGGHVKVQVKDVMIKELPPTKDAPTWESLGGPKAALSKVKPNRGQKNNAKKPAAKNDEEAAEAGKEKNVPKAKYVWDGRGKKDTSYNKVDADPRPATEQLEMFNVADGYEIELVVQESEGIGKFVAVYFDQRGRLWTQTALEYPVDAKDNPSAANALYQSHARDKVLVYSRESLEDIPEGGLTDPTVFADGLAIPLGILPWGNGDSAYVLHGPDVIHFTDTDGDGKADQRKVILTGMGVQDSHLFPHQFTRAPGGWIWMAQGLFNTSDVKTPGEKKGTPWRKCSLARVRPDGTEFEVVTTGPNNIWGLAMTGEGETFIQEANDFGYPVMPFHEFAYYPGGMRGLKKTYQPSFPPEAEFRMGGTSLSGLSLLESGPVVDEEAEHTMLVANPIISTVQTLGMHRNGPRWDLEQIPSLVSCDDPLFRPVALTQGPDGCIYIVDWYNKVISHNEVPRNHPDRDKTRGRIWRIKPKDAGTLPDFTQLSDEDVLAMLGTKPTARAHMAWQTLADRAEESDSVRASLRGIVGDSSASDARRIQAFWALDDADTQARRFLASPNRNVRREAVEAGIGAKKAVNDPDSEVRFAALTYLGRQLPKDAEEIIPILVGAVKPSLSEPTVISSRTREPIPAEDAYDREFERYLIRLFLEKHPGEVATFLDSEASQSLPAEGRILASLALPPKESAARVAAILPELDRAPDSEELLRLAEFPGAPGAQETLTKLLQNPESRDHVASQLLDLKTRLDAKKMATLLTEPARELLKGEAASTGFELAGAFNLTALAPDLLAALEAKKDEPAEQVKALNALALLGSKEVDSLGSLAETTDHAEVKEAALKALAASPNPAAADKLIALYPDLSLPQQRSVLAGLSSKKASAKKLVTALVEERISPEVIDVSIAERLATVLGDDPALDTLVKELSNVFRNILVLDGTPGASVPTKVTVPGPFTIEAWVRLAPGINNRDILLSGANNFQLNFNNTHLTVHAGKPTGDVAKAQVPISPELWTHIAVTRDESGEVTIYLDGELDSVGTKKTTDPFELITIGQPGRFAQSQMAVSEFRIWGKARSGEEIRRTFDRSFVDVAKPAGLVFYNAGGGSSWREMTEGARVVPTTDLPPLLTAAEAEALDAKFAKYLALAEQGGDVEKGAVLAPLCTSCHVIDGQGGLIGPELSGAGAMGIEGLLRNIITPNAAMESGYRIYRVEMKSGEIIDAFFVRQDKQAVVIRQAGLPDRRIPKSDIRKTTFIRRSLMPEGLLDGLNDEQVADLLAYLMTLK
ncbi:MAG: DUF1080 domain-containing protein [Verrucomicrobiota bacterium JB023]|nr:DUF1080 domain-containing protein [Verrucomicrobiota bacterium JB023]